MATKKTTKKVTSGRVKSQKPTDKHAEQCTVCKHPQKQEIEGRYLAFEPSAEVAFDYDLSHDAIDRHARYYSLGQKRISNTEKVLESLVERGMRQVVNVPLETVLDSVRELHKVRGKYQQDKKNDADVERDAEDKKWAEEQLKEYMATYGVPREQAIEDMRTLAPTVSQWLH